MQFGILTNFDEPHIRFAKDVGFTCIELGLSPGADVNAETILNGDAGKVRKLFDELGMTISSVCHYDNPLHPDPDERARQNAYVAKLIDAAGALGAPVVALFAGRDFEKSLEDNIPIFKEVHSVTADLAEKQGVKVAFENCPRQHPPLFRGSNIAYSPEAWEMMFDAVPSAALGIEYDPSHMVWLEIDYIQAIHEFADRIHHVHAKDAEVLKDELARRGIFGSGWWRYRTPGYGDVDWERVFGALHDVGYDGDVDIEHGDPVFTGDRFNEGLQRAYEALSDYFNKPPQR